MNEQTHGRTADSARALALLTAQFGAAQTELTGLRGELALLKTELEATKASDLREANERLVVSAIAAEASAELATRHLAELRQVSQRIGVAVYPEDGHDAATLNDRADSCVGTGPDGQGLSGLCAPGQNDLPARVFLGLSVGYMFDVIL